jgi:hypothetical protein
MALRSTLLGDARDIALAHAWYMTNTPNLPRETDTALAALWNDRAAVDGKLAASDKWLQRLAGATFRYVGRGGRQVSDLTTEQAVAILEPILAANPDDGYGYGRLETCRSASIGQARNALTERVELEARRAELAASIRDLESRWTGWSRFFLVTSSAGHVHRSMACSTCRPTTTYGWLPELSGQTEAQAVAELGPALCSVCFPSAPVEHQGGKLTAAQARKRAA